MPLFWVQDSDRPLWIKADNWQDALAQWKSVIAIENEMEEKDVDEPQGINFVADDRDLVWKEGTA